VSGSRVSLLNTWVDALDQPTFLGTIADAVTNHRPLLITNHNVNSLALAQRDRQFVDFVNRGDLVFIDGMPLVYLARLLGHPLRASDRQAVLDWIWPLLELAQAEHWRVVHLGSHEGVLEPALQAIQLRVPGVDVRAISGFFDHSPGSPGSRTVIADLWKLEPDVLLVGFGMPLQERWLDHHLAALPDTVVITVGGIIGFLGGERPSAPRWLGSLGLEWMFRLATEPRRLWRRYLVEPVVLVRPILRALYHERLASSRRPT
jgi:N-acetylglucosaminyldiphosphoundecaprenol N-acetyl-beta-D-mannosaminyltransferase